MWIGVVGTSAIRYMNYVNFLLESNKNILKVETDTEKHCTVSEEKVNIINYNFKSFENLSTQGLPNRCHWDIYWLITVVS